MSLKKDSGEMRFKWGFKGRIGVFQIAQGKPGLPSWRQMWAKTWDCQVHGKFWGLVSGKMTEFNHDSQGVFFREACLRNCHQSKQSCVSTLQERVYFPGYQVNLLQCTNIRLCVSNSSGCKPNFKSRRSLRMPGPHSLPTNVLFYCLGPPAGKKTKAITANCTSQ